MHKTLLLAFLCFMVGGLAAQNFSVSSQLATQQGNASQELSPGLILRNLTSRPIELQWELEKHNFPTDWTVQICDKICRGADSKNNTFVLAPYEVSHFRLALQPNGHEGIAYADIQLFETHKRSTTETLLSFSAAAQHGATAARANAQRIYPNPAVDYIMLQDDDNAVKTIEIYNVIGRKILDYPAGAQYEKYDIADLPRGMYMVRLIDGKGNIIKTQRISKYNP